MLRTREISAFGDELMKISARRSVEVIRELVARGDPESLAKAEQIAKAPGAVKATAMGSQIKDLGMGGEGLATLVATPEGMRVRKLYDPQGLSSPEMIARKAQVGRQVSDPSLAKFHGEAATPRGGGTAHMMEYVPGQRPAMGSPAIAQTKAQATAAIAPTGFNNPVDIRRGNMLVDSRTGQTKVIDYLPATKDEFSLAKGTPASATSSGSSGNLIASESGAKVLNPQARDFSIPSQLEGQQAAHLKQKFMGRGAVQTPAVTGRQVDVWKAQQAKKQMPAAAATAAGTPTRASRPNAMRPAMPTTASRPKAMRPAAAVQKATAVSRPSARRALTGMTKPQNLARKALNVAKRVL